MSLKDRLKNQQKQIAPILEKEVKPTYYASDKEAQAGDLGVLDTLFADDELNSIFVSGAKNIYLEKKGKTYKSTTTYRDNTQLETIIKKIAQNENIDLDETKCFKFKYELGINATATLPPLSNVPTLFIKYYKDKHATLEILQEELTISKEIALVLKALCAIEKNILIIGPACSLKTTLLSALAKMTPSNTRTVIIDSENEFKITHQNYTNYDFSIIDKKTSNNLLDSILNSKPEKLIVNTKDESLLTNLISKIENTYKGVITSLEANSTAQALEKLTQITQKNLPYLTSQNARAMVLGTFDIVITVKKDEIGRKKISSISEINLSAQDDIIKEIFSLDYQNQHNSTGVKPAFYEDIKNNSLPINDSIFDSYYKHTYHKNAELDSASQYIKRSANIDILKKFKKELPTQIEQVEDLITEEPIISEPIVLNEEEIMQKAQEKFNELKRNAQMQGEFEIQIESLEEPKEIQEEQKDENLQ